MEELTSALFFGQFCCNRQSGRFLQQSSDVSDDHQNDAELPNLSSIANGPNGFAPWRPFIFGDPSRRGQLEPVDQYSWYRLSKALTTIAQLPNESQLGTLMMAWIQAYTALEEFAQSPLPLSTAAAKEIQNNFANLVRAHRRKNEPDESKQLDWNEKIQPWSLGGLKKAIADFETVLARESPGMPVFFVPKKGIYSTADLIERAEQDFAGYKLLPRNALEEIQQAGRCLAFDLFTAHAIHSMRAAEIVVIDLLCKYYNLTIPTSQRNWGAYVAALKTHGAPPDLLSFLYEVVRVERNESIHPTKLMTEIEAQRIYTIAKGAIMAIMEHQETLKAYDPLIPKAP